MILSKEFSHDKFAGAACCAKKEEVHILKWNNWK